MKRLLLSCVTMMLMLASLQVSAQDRTVSGRVTSAEDGGVLPGVSVVLKGTAIGTQTDGDGRYSLSIPSTGGTLTFSFISLKTQDVVVTSQSSIDIVMEADAATLNEIVVVGAGGLTTRAKELGSANTILNTQNITAGKAVNLAAGMQGKVAGLQINGTSSGVNPEYRLVLRGARSMTGNNQALIVLDNVIVPNSVLSNINMNDVESVNILNGAGAAALYGSQASNGAVIITTKNGKGSKPGITFSQNVQASQVAFFPKIQDQYGSGGSAYGTDPDGQPYFNYLENQSYGPKFDGTLRPLGPKLEDGTQLYTPYSYKKGHDDFWNVGVTSQSDLSVSSGDDKSSLYFSAQYVTVKGTTPGDKFTRGNIRLNGTRKLTDKFEAKFNTTFAPNKYDISTQTASIYSNLLNMPSNVDITRYANWKTDPIASPNGFYNPWYLNPYFSADNYRAIQKNNYLTGNVELNFKPIVGLTLLARQGIATRIYSSKESVGSYNYSDYAEHTDQSSKVDIVASVNEGSLQTTNLVTDFIGEYKKSFGDISLTAIVGTQLTQNSSRTLNVGISGLVVDDLYNLNNGTGTPSYSEAEYKTRQVGLYGKVTMGFKDFVFVTATGRNDWDSRLAPENRSFFYPSVEAAVVLSEAVSTIKDNALISYLKVRGGVSKTGQVNLGNSTDFGAYYLQPIFDSNLSYTTSNGFPYGSLPGYSLGNSLVNYYLKPEISNSWEAGFDLNLLNDRITTTFTYYNIVTDDQTISTNISNSTGFAALRTNLGSLKSNGIEASLNYTPIRTADWTVTVGGNYTLQKTEVTAITAGLERLNLATSGNAVSAAVVGQSFPVIMGFDYNRDSGGHVIVDPVTGLPSSTSAITILGNALPKHLLGITGEARYKAIRFNILFEYRGDYRIYNGVGTEMDWSGTSYRSALYDRSGFIFPNSVIPSGDGGYVKNTDVAISNGNGNSGFWSDGINRSVTSNYVTDGNFLKLREVALSYDLPLGLISKLKLKGATVSVQGRNLFMWMSKDNYYTDPEYSSAGASSNGMGLNSLSQTPPVRYYGGTVTLRF